jgi:hypothetical protein
MLLAIRRSWVGLAMLAFLSMRLAYLSARPDREWITHVPDDAFYYVQIASSWAKTGHFSFDAISVTSGFQLVFAYFIGGIFKLLPALQVRQLWAITSVLACLLFSWAAQILAGALDAFDRNARRRTIHGMAVLAAFSCPMAATLSTNLMESLFVLPLSAVTLAALLQAPGRIHPRWVFVLGFAGVSVRSDFIVLPAAWLAACAWSNRSSRTASIVPSVICLMGSMSAEAFILVHNEVLTGRATQMSTAIKFHWSQLAGHSTIPAAFLLLRTLLPSGLAAAGGIWGLAPGVGIIAASIAASVRTYLGGAGRAAAQGARMAPARSFAGDPRYLPFVAALFTCGGYGVVYSLDSAATQVWYAANLIVPFAVLLCGLLAFIRKYGGASPVGAVVVVYLASSAAGLAWEPWPNQTQTYVASMRLGIERPPGRVGSWNAGIMRYFSKQDVVNLDGLIDDEAAGDVMGNCIFCFILRHDVRFIADSNVMFQEDYAERGGYGDGRLRNCATFLADLDDDVVRRSDERWRGERIALYRIDRECLRRPP